MDEQSGLGSGDAGAACARACGGYLQNPTGSRCVRFSGGNMETIGLIAAMSQESRALLRYIQGWKRVALGAFQGARFQLMDRDCLLVTTGMGLARAAAGTRALLAAVSPHVLISFGIAGAVNEHLHIGDVVVAGNNCSLEMDRLGRPQPLALLSQVAWEAAAQALQPEGAQLLPGTAITTRGSQFVPQSQETMAHPVLEMETAGIAQVAAEVGIPLVSIRSVSDGPQAPIPFDLEAVLDDEYNFRTGKMLMLVLRSPRIILQSRQVARNSRKAADCAAKVLLAVLSQPSPVLFA